MNFNEFGTLEVLRQGPPSLVPFKPGQAMNLLVNISFTLRPHV